ncbi:hypothetical protein KM043_013732 [Ampulex compressa]|nr:hypothetical protein KM043_013732 [Ampulex compressa]
MSARSKTLEESADTENKEATPRSPAIRPPYVERSAAYVPAGVRLIVVSNRLYPGILIRSQLSALVACLEQNVRVYCEKRDSSGASGPCLRTYVAAHQPGRVPVPTPDGRYA